ncbi:MAG: peptide-methionine (S)-S-oxide reductase MsrA [Alphaproteobacteria bacterium]
MTQTAIFGAGCFWGVELEFSETPGVVKATSGYSGGDVEHPTYEQVCTGATGHAEVVLVEFDPAIVSYRALVEKFFALHDPTQKDRQGPDIGTQYRSVIFFASPQQQREAIEAKENLEKALRFKRPLATIIEPAQAFWPAEDYHQQYLKKRGQGACRIKV